MKGVGQEDEEERTEGTEGEPSTLPSQPVQSPSQDESRDSELFHKIINNHLVRSHTYFTMF